MVAGRYADMCQYTGVVCTTIREYYCADVPAFSYIACWSVGRPVYRRIRIPMSWHTGVPVYGITVQCSSVLVWRGPLYGSTDVQVYRYSDTQCAGVLDVRCTGVPVYRCHGKQVYPYTSSVPAYSYTNVMAYKCTRLQCSGVVIYQRSSAPV